MSAGRNCFSVPLVTWDDLTPCITSAPFIGAYVPDPRFQGLFPLDRVNEVVLHWCIGSMPTGASSVSVTPYSLPSITINRSGGVYSRALFYNAAAVATRFTFDELDSTNEWVIPHPYTIRKTTADPSVDILATSVIAGTRHPLPTAEPYVIFRVDIDANATEETGVMTLWADYSWAG